MVLITHLVIEHSFPSTESFTFYLFIRLVFNICVSTAAVNGLHNVGHFLQLVFCVTVCLIAVGCVVFQERASLFP